MWSAVGVFRRTTFSAVCKGSPIRSLRGGGYRCLTVEPTEKGKEKAEEITVTEAKKLMRLVNVDEMKKKLGCVGNEETVSYTKLIEASQGLGIARSLDEAHAFARILDDAGVILIFRDKVYLQPDKIGLFFRLTFWEFSWDVMEPITFFTTATGIIVGYAYFLMTSRDPTYQDFMKRLFLSRQRKLLKSRKFDVERFKELEKKWSCSSSSYHSCHANSSIRKCVGVDLDLEDSLHSRRD
ncbi:hypothetical protein N665_0713s0005 [Sinapis alba]|nr:hypothetical protein N665_0713s0005 [Sinapis alba]